MNVSTQKNIILVSKGPSTQYIPESDDYSISCLNNATVNCEVVDYWFCHDQDAVDVMVPKEWLKIKNAIIPYFPQKSNPGGFSQDFTYEVWSDIIHQHNPDCKIHPVALGVHDLNNLIVPDNLPHMGETYSILQTAATWLGMYNKVDNLITCGIDPEGGYHPMFQTINDGSQWSKQSITISHEKFHSIARNFKYSIHRLNENGDTEQVV